MFAACAAPAYAQSGPQAPPPAGTLELAGPRFGVTMLSQGVIDKLKKDRDITIGSTISQFGWQFERQFYSNAGGVTSETADQYQPAVNRVLHDQDHHPRSGSAPTSARRRAKGEKQGDYGGDDQQWGDDHQRDGRWASTMIPTATSLRTPSRSIGTAARIDGPSVAL